MSSGDDPIDRLFSDAEAIVTVLDTAKEPSLRSAIDDLYRRAIVLSAASFFETRITSAILRFADLKSNGAEGLTSFVKNKAVARQYHTFFDWERGNVNKFLSLFGDAFKKKVQSDFSAHPDVAKSAARFVELGHLRNQLVHENFAKFAIDLTTKEIRDLYREAQTFVAYLEEALSK